MKIIAVANQKGGCGKTITAVSLAGALAGAGKNVLFVDLDPQGHASSAFGIKEPDSSMTSYLIFESFLATKTADISSIIIQRYQTLWVVPSHITLSTMEQKMANIRGAVLVVSGALKTEAAQKFDYIILDTPPNLGFLTLNALHAAGEVIVPLDISLFSLNGVSQIDDMLELAKDMGFKKPHVNFLITLYDSRSNFAKTFLEKAKTTFSNKLFRTIVRQNIKLREAAQAGQVIFEYDSSCNGAKDYTALVKEIMPEFKGESIHIKPLAVQPQTAPEAFFKLLAPDAENVYLAGSFNNWAQDESSVMKKLDNGIWVKIISLPQGSYHYKFIVDGKWIEDPANNMVEADAFGGKNSLVVVS